MTFLLVALVVGLLGAAPALVTNSRANLGRGSLFAILTVCYTIIGWIVLYNAMPSIAYPLFGGYLFVLIAWWTISAILSSIASDEINWSAVFPIGSIVLVLAVVIINAEMFNAGKYASLIGDIKDRNMKHWSQDIQPIDQTKIRLVPKEYAISLAKTALTKDGLSYGSQFEIDENCVTMQKIRDDYYYLLPLDYKSFKVWTSVDYVPCYIKILATDPYAKPILVSGKKMKYTPAAFFNDNLQRRLYQKHYDKVLMDYSFEEDDNGNIFWVVTACKPTIGYSGKIVEGVILYNPETGEDTFLTKKQVNDEKRYTWIDRVTPQDMVEGYINYWGSLKDGWWNSFWEGLNILKPETPTMNYSSDGRCIFVTPVTSSSKKDQAMAGLIYTDARTGHSFYYTVSGGATEKAIIEAVDNATSYKKWHANSQIVYENVYGKLSALVPLLGENGNYQGLAIVENENKRVALGTKPYEALVEYQKIITSAGGQISTEVAKSILEYKGKIERIGWEITATGKQYYAYFLGFKNSFAITASVQSELELTKEGDVVLIKYIDSKQTTVPVMYFHNITLDLQSSKAEKSVQQQMMKRQEDTRSKADVDDFKDQLKNMSDEDLKKLMTKSKK